MPNALDEDEPPLDPVMERVQRRLRRLMLIGGLTLGLGLVAVLAAILYRIASMDSTPEGGPVALEAGSAAVAPGARLLSTALDGDRLALTFDEGGAPVVVVIDLRTLTVAGRIRLGPAAVPD